MNILHLEDDGPLREILAVALKAAQPSCEIHQFAESDNAIRYVRDHAGAIDLFILDIRVPGSIDGLEVARRVRDMKCAGAIVLTSAYRAPTPETIKELNCEWYPKPWHIFEVTTKLLALARESTLPIAPVTKPVLEQAKPVDMMVVPPKPEASKPVNQEAAVPPKPENTKPSPPSQK